MLIWEMHGCLGLFGGVPKLRVHPGRNSGDDVRATSLASPFGAIIIV